MARTLRPDVCDGEEEEDVFDRIDPSRVEEEKENDVVEESKEKIVEEDKSKGDNNDNMTTWELMKKDPSFVPRASRYFLHDDREGDEGPKEGEDDESPGNQEVPLAVQIRDGKVKKLWRGPETGEKWVHDKFEQLMEEVDKSTKSAGYRGYRHHARPSRANSRPLSTTRHYRLKLSSERQSTKEDKMMSGTYCDGKEQESSPNAHRFVEGSTLRSRRERTAKRNIFRSGGSPDTNDDWKNPGDYGTRGISERISTQKGSRYGKSDSSYSSMNQKEYQERNQYREPRRRGRGFSRRRTYQRGEDDGASFHHSEAQAFPTIHESVSKNLVEDAGSKREIINDTEKEHERHGNTFQKGQSKYHYIAKSVTAS